MLAVIMALGVDATAQTTRTIGPLPGAPPTSLEGSRLSGNSLPGPGGDTIISPDDVLEIYILDVPELSRQYRVSPSGTVVLPLLERPLQAAGLKATDFADLLVKQLRDQGLVSKPFITVSIAASRLQSVAVTGAVKMPQIYPVFGHTTLLDILSQAQGLSDDASNTAVISRGKLGVEATKLKERPETVDLTKLFQSGDAEYNPDLYPGDRVIVPRAGIVYVVGAVVRPGGYPIKQVSNGMTVMQALAFAEDVKPTAKRRNTVVIRLDPEAPGGRKRIPLDLKKILAGDAQDPMLQANDILFIPDSQGARALRRGLEAAIAAATGVAIYSAYR
jgi:polysaccharide export outer membrane protein